MMLAVGAGVVVDIFWIPLMAVPVLQEWYWL